MDLFGALNIYNVTKRVVRLPMERKDKVFVCYNSSTLMPQACQL